MFKYVISVILILQSAALSQNLQLHYDFGQGRHYFTSTIEMFKPDEYGSTFFFIDMDYDNPGNKSMSLGYWEFSRYINLHFVKDLSATVQYNDGATIWGPIGAVWLGGFSYPINLGFITINTDFLYAHFEHARSPDYQMTFVWFKSFLKEKIHFMGYMDIWSRDKNEGGKKPVLQTEPQIWYVLNNHLRVGSEIEISRNFLPFKGWKAMPTLGLKWVF